MLSGGLGSWAAAKIAAQRFGVEHTTLLFCDVGGDHSDPHIGEDEDTYRFVVESAENIGAELVTVSDGRTIWDVFKDDRFLGNSRLANCSKYLKQIPARTWLDANRDPAETTVVVGIDWTEIHRLPAIERNYLPFGAWAPLCDDEHRQVDPRAWAEAEGLHIPRLYRAGFAHNNCGGGCVRGGKAHWALLLRVYPERYAVWERKEQELRDHLGKDVSILKRYTSPLLLEMGPPLTLREFREGIEAQTVLFDANDYGGCGCFVDYGGG